MKRDNDNNKDVVDSRILKKQCALNADSLRCPITREIFRFPVTADDGFTYEKWAIDKHLYDGDGDAVSPMTRESISSYYDNKLVMGFVKDFLEINPDQKEEQFGEDVYTDFLQNTSYFVRLLENKNFIKFSEAKGIQLNHNFKYGNGNTSVISYISKFLTLPAMDKVFEKILTNSFDLNCENFCGDKPMYFIAKSCSLEYIMIAINQKADIINISGKGNFITIICSNKNLSDSDKITLIEYLCDNNMIADLFDEEMKSFNEIKEIENEELTEKVLGILMDKVQYLIAHPNFIKMIVETQDYDNTFEMLDKLLKFDNYDQNKLYEYCKKINDADLVPGYLTESIRSLYKKVDENFDNEEKENINSKIKVLYTSKISVSDIDRKLLEYNIEKIA